MFDLTFHKEFFEKKIKSSKEVTSFPRIRFLHENFEDEFVALEKKDVLGDSRPCFVVKIKGEDFFLKQTSAFNTDTWFKFDEKTSERNSIITKNENEVMVTEVDLAEIIGNGEVYSKAILHQNGNIYAILNVRPYNKIIRINTNDDTATIINTPNWYTGSSTDKIVGSSLDEDGSIMWYTTGNTNKSAYYFNPFTEVFSTQSTGLPDHSGGQFVLSQKKEEIASRNYGSGFYKYDIKTKLFSNITGVSGYYPCMSNGYEGNIYMLNSTRRAIYNVDDNILTTYSGTNYSYAPSSSVSFKNKMYCIPQNNNDGKLIEVDMLDMSKTIITTLEGKTSFSWANGVIGGDGFLYIAPKTCGKLYRMNCETKEVETILEFADTIDKTEGFVVAMNGKIYSVPNSQYKKIIVIDTGAIGNDGLVTPFYNK